MLKKQNTSPIVDFFSTEYSQSLVTVVLTAFFGLLAPTVAWYKSKQIIPFSDREKTFREIAIKRYDNLYKTKWAIINQYIIDDETEKPIPPKVKTMWEQIKNRRFPEMYIADIEYDFDKYIKNQSNLLEIIKTSSGNGDDLKEDLIVEIDQKRKQLAQDLIDAKNEAAMML